MFVMNSEVSRYFLVTPSMPTDSETVYYRVLNTEKNTLELTDRSVSRIERYIDENTDRIIMRRRL